MLYACIQTCDVDCFTTKVLKTKKKGSAQLCKVIADWSWRFTVFKFYNHRYYFRTEKIVLLQKLHLAHFTHYMYCTCCIETSYVVLLLTDSTARKTSPYSCTYFMMTLKYVHRSKHTGQLYKTYHLLFTKQLLAILPNSTAYTYVSHIQYKGELFNKPSKIFLLEWKVSKTYNLWKNVLL